MAEAAATSWLSQAVLSVEDLQEGCRWEGGGSTITSWL
jgi:hypothetical protein